MALRICCPSCNVIGPLPEQYQGQALICRACNASFQVSDGHSVIRSNPSPAGAHEAHDSDPSRTWLIWRAVAVIGVVGLGLATARLVAAGLELLSPHRGGATVAASLPKETDPPRRVDPPKPVDPPQPVDPPMVADVPLPADPPRVADVPQPAAPLKEADVPKPADHPKDFTPPKPVDNLRVTRAAFDKIEWQMSRQDIESILGEGEPVDNILVIRAMGSKLDDKREPYKRVEQGLWMKWKGDDQTNIFVQFGGPNLVQNPDGSYSVGPSTECSLVLFITEKPHKGQMNVETRDIRIYWRLGTGYGEIHDLAS